MSGYYKSFEDFLEFSNAFHERNYLCDLLYLNIYEYYEKLFGKENISVFIFEEFIINTSEFTKRYVNFWASIFLIMKLEGAIRAYQ